MPIRPFALPGDIDTLAEILPPSFQYPENEAWSIQADELESMLDEMNGIKRFWPLIRALQWVAPPMRDMLRGYVWEEDGKPVGVVNVLRQGDTDQWLIGNVSVLPAYRRCGIARQLVEAVVQYARERGASQITLAVIDGNVPAYNLYERLGFVHYSGQTEFCCEPDGPVAEIPLPAGYEVEPRRVRDWRPRYELALRIVPEAVRRFEPVEEGNYRQPRLLGLIAPVIFKAMGGRPYPYLVRRLSDGQVVASISLFMRHRPGGMNRISLNLDPACGEIAPALVQTLLCEIERRSPGRRIEAQAKDWQPSVIDAMEAAGFQRRADLHNLGMMCQG
jgi:ribosomal protein S18 acetylase RimI-like enzyme